MSANDFSLATSSRSGHPVYAFGSNKAASANIRPDKTMVSPHSGVEVSPHGTWKTVNVGPGTAKIEQLDLSSRYLYVPKKASDFLETRPNNALRKGLRPTKSFELPPAIKAHQDMAATRSIYRRSKSPTDDEDGFHSEPSPNEANSKITTGSKLRFYMQDTSAPSPSKVNSKLTTRSKLRFYMQNTSGPLQPTIVKPMVHKRRVHEISSDEDNDDRALYEATPPRSKAPRSITPIPSSVERNNTTPPAHNNDPSTPTLSSKEQDASPNPSHSSRTFIHEDLPATTDPTDDLPDMEERISSTATPSHPTTQPAAIAPSTSNTILRIYLPDSDLRTYIPLSLRSCPTIDELFLRVATICEVGMQEIALLKMHIDPSVEATFGRMAVKKSVEESFQIFLEAVEAVEAKNSELGIRIWVGVEVEVD
ncbi:MAG: hypothetical protein Q9209_005419 [Squamulea sp. 1 TL-2023]